MMPFVLFGSRSFVGLTMLTLLLYGALGALFVLLPFAMMRVGGVPAADAGGALMPTIILIAVLSPPLGGLAGRIGPRPLLVYGSMIVAGGLLMLLRVDVGSSYWTGLFPAFCLVGLGLAGAVAALTTAVMASVKPSATGTESGYNSVIAPDRPHSARMRRNPTSANRQLSDMARGQTAGDYRPNSDTGSVCFKVLQHRHLSAVAGRGLGKYRPCITQDICSASSFEQSQPHTLVQAVCFRNQSWR